MLGPPPRATRLAPLAAFALPASLAAALSGDGMGFLDAPELASAAAGLGVTHPPGHPLWVALSSVASLVPLGSVAYRLTLLSALALGALGALTYGVARRLLQRLEVPPEVSALLALAAALSATLGEALFRQATRVEVYALAALLSTAVLALAARDEAPLPWRARWAVLLVGLGGANHHFIALTTAPLGAWLVLEHLRRAPSWKSRALALAPLGVLGALALSPYALLPLRADAEGSLVRVRTLGDFVWTVTAKTFQKNTGSGVPGTLGERLLEVLEVLGGSLSALGLVAALAGAYIAVRLGARRELARLGVVAGVVCGARAALGFVRDNPDAAGYLAPAVVAVAVMGAAFTGGVWLAVQRAPEPPRGPTAGARLALLGLLVVLPSLAPLYLAVRSAQAAAVDRSHAPEALSEALLTPLPPRAVVLAYHPETVFRAWYAARVEGARPDVTLVPVPFVPYPGMTNALLAREGALLPLVRDYLAHGAPRSENLAALALERGLYLETDPLNLPAFVPWLVPAGLLCAVRSEPTTLNGVQRTAAAHFAALDALDARLALEPGARARVQQFTLWRSYNDALFFAARGARPEARNSVQRGLRLVPEATELRGLAEALETPGAGPVDVTPFLPR